MDLKATYAPIGKFIESHPSETYGQIGATLGLSRSQVTRIARVQGIKRQPGKRSSALEAAIAAIEAASPKPDCAPAGEAAGTSPASALAADLPVPSESAAAAPPFAVEGQAESADASSADAA